MAYGNYGGNVFRNGIRMKSHEDQTPYCEQVLVSGYHQAFGRQEGTNPHHAVLGEKRIRFCAYKASPVLYLDGVEVALDSYRQRFDDDDEDGDTDYYAPGSGDLDGYHFEWRVDDSPERVDLVLREPDGTLWTGFSGYGMGAGYEED